MKTEYTRGPWQIKDGSGLPVGMLKHYNTTPVPYIVDTGGEKIANLYNTIAEGEGYSASLDDVAMLNADANARLIAAAPELLEALELAVDIIQGEWPEEQWAEQGVPAMLAAIKKAKGE